MGYFDRINEVLDAAAPVIMLRTTEFERAYAGLKSWCKEADAVLYKWNCVEGLLEMSLNFDTVMSVDERVSDLLQMLVEVERRQDSNDIEMFVFEGVYDFMYRADVKILLRKLTVDLPKSGNKKRVVLLNPVPELPLELCYSIPVLEIPTPDAKELGKLLDSQIKVNGLKISTDVKTAMLEAAEGMTLEAASLAFKLAAIRTEYGEEAPAVVRESRNLYLEPKPYD
ncbi:MAG: hypothetical protein IPN95_28555 [Bacteroidetes bacterium]|nr:hypothetical protein [Bacteroidota bacterium]